MSIVCLCNLGTLIILTLHSVAMLDCAFAHPPPPPPPPPIIVAVYQPHL